MAIKEEKSILPVIQKEASPIIKRLQSIDIVDEKTKGEAATQLNELKAFQDRVVAYKEKKTKPLNALLKIVRDETRDLEANLKTAIDSTRSKLGAYQTEQKRIADKKAEDIAARVGEGKGHFTTETAVRKIDELEKPSGTVSAGAGEVKFRTVKKLKITDTVKLYQAIYASGDLVTYLNFNEIMIFAALKGGVVLEGAEIEEVQEAASYR